MLIKFSTCKNQHRSINKQPNLHQNFVIDKSPVVIIFPHTKKIRCTKIEAYLAKQRGDKY